MEIKKVFKFNWAGIEKAAQGKCQGIISIIGILSGNKVNFSREHYQQAVKINKLEKTSFVLNVEQLLNNKRATVQDKCLVVFLAAKRNYLDYLKDKNSTLPLMVVEDILDVDKLNNNPLLYTKGDFIYFNEN